MKQIIYNGAMGPTVTAGGIPFTVGESVTVNDDAVAELLLGKPYFVEAAPVALPEPARVVKVNPTPPPTE